MHTSNGATEQPDQTTYNATQQTNPLEESKVNVTLTEVVLE